jgi:hypothetical protein
MNAMPASAPEAETDYTEAALEDIRRQIHVERSVITEARARRDRVKAIAEKFPGARRISGSIAHGTATNRLPHADGSVVLDRRSYAELGPDGDGVGPNAHLAEIARFVMEAIRSEYPNGECKISKRAIVFSFNEPIDDEDLIVALTRASGRDRTDHRAPDCGPGGRGFESRRSP